MTTTVSVSQSPIFLSEIFPINISQPNWCCFRLNPEVSKEEGNRLSFHLSFNLPKIVVTWHDRHFYALGMPNISMPTLKEWQDIFEDVQEKVTGFSDRYYTIELVEQPQLLTHIQSQMAFQVLRKSQFHPSPPIDSDNKVHVRRELDFWAETIELQEQLYPALALTVHSSIIYEGNLEEFYQNHPNKQNTETFLKGLKVRDKELRSYGTITRLAGTVGEHREKLIKKATRESSKQALRNAPDKQNLVTVEFRNRESRDYPMALLHPVVTAETADRFEVDYGKLLKATKISPRDRTALLTNYKKKAEEAVTVYGFQLDRSINSRDYKSLFWQPQIKIDETQLLFGQGFIGKRSEVLKGLSLRNRGGVYRRHNSYNDLSRPIRITALKICDFTVNPFLDQVRQRLESYGFSSQIVTKKSVIINNLRGTDARAEVERAINEIMAIPTDIVLTFLPQSDRKTDDENGGSLYHQIYSRLLRRAIASQAIYSDTLSSVAYHQILNPVIPGILAKLGNLPFILAEPLKIADCIVGLDVSRKLKQNLPGTKNVCASVRIYGKQGEFIHYRSEDGLINGEEIPQNFLETLLPESELRGKIILIYRDGRFSGKEVEHLLAWAKTIGSKFILVECRKSCIPRLYDLHQKIVAAPEKGLALRLSSREAVLVTTKVSLNIGLARPLRLNIREEGHQVSIEDVLETTLKLTLVHYGALQTTRLPLPLYGADRIAYLRLNGINFSGMLEGDRQFWL